MAIVREIASGTAVVKIDDSCCRDITQEEAARRWAEVERVILMIDERERERRTSSVSADGAATFPNNRNRARQVTHEMGKAMEKDPSTALRMTGDGDRGTEERRTRACERW